MLVAWSNGDEAALESLTPLIYDELRRLARHYMKDESPGHTLQATALVHEAYLQLIEQKQVKWQNRAHFFAISAKLMRRVLVSMARARHATSAEARARRFPSTKRRFFLRTGRRSW